MRYLATILYEDHPRETKEFGPHNLVLACVADRTHQTIWQIKRLFDGRPMGGDSKVVKESSRVDIIAPDCHPVVMLLDDDKIRRHLGLASGAASDDVAAAIRANCSEPDKLHIFLLTRNVDDLVQVAARSTDWKGEIKKKPVVRDRILNKAAYNVNAAQRALIQEEVPGLADLVEFLVSLIAQ